MLDPERIERFKAAVAKHEGDRRLRCREPHAEKVITDDMLFAPLVPGFGNRTFGSKKRRKRLVRINRWQWAWVYR